MSPILFFTRVTGLALLTSVGGYLLIKKLAPRLRILQPQRSIFENGVQEFQRGFETMLFGGGPSEADIQKERESRRIPID